MKDAAIQIKTKTEIEIYTTATSIATIINNSGATIEKIELQQGKSSININQYLNKNYAIRIASGSNVVVQKL